MRKDVPNLKKKISTKFIMAFVIYMPTEVHVFFALLNLVVCAALIIVRVYHHKKEKNNSLKLTLTGLLCMLMGFFTCLAILNTSSEWWFGDKKWCGLSMRLNSASYALHRVLLYIFIIVRLEVVNQCAFMNPMIIVIGKVVIGVIGTFLVLTTTLSTKGITTDGQQKCKFWMNNGLLVTLFVIDGLICAGGTWVFVRPLRLTLRHMESDFVHYMVKRTRFWSIVSLMSTLTSMLFVAIFDGYAGVIAFDCSVTCFSLLMMMSPVKPQVLLKNYSNSRSKVRVEVEEM